MTDADNEALVAALAHAAGLAIPAGYTQGVAENLQRLLVQARIVAQFDLTPEMEPAPIFRP